MTKKVAIALWIVIMLAACGKTKDPRVGTPLSCHVENVVKVEQANFSLRYDTVFWHQAAVDEKKVMHLRGYGGRNDVRLVDFGNSLLFAEAKRIYRIRQNNVDSGYYQIVEPMELKRIRGQWMYRSIGIRTRSKHKIGEILYLYATAGHVWFVRCGVDAVFLDYHDYSFKSLSQFADRFEQSMDVQSQLWANANFLVILLFLVYLLTLGVLLLIKRIDYQRFISGDTDVIFPIYTRREDTLIFRPNRVYAICLTVLSVVLLILSAEQVAIFLAPLPIFILYGSRVEITKDKMVADISLFGKSIYVTDYTLTQCSLSLIRTRNGSGIFLCQGEEKRLLTSVRRREEDAVMQHLRQVLQEIGVNLNNEDSEEK